MDQTALVLKGSAAGEDPCLLLLFDRLDVVLDDVHVLAEDVENGLLGHRILQAREEAVRQELDEDLNEHPKLFRHEHALVNATLVHLREERGDEAEASLLNEGLNELRLRLGCARARGRG